MLLIAGGGDPSHFHCWLEGWGSLYTSIAGYRGVESLYTSIAGYRGGVPFILPLLAVGSGWGGGGMEIRKRH